VNNKRRSNFNPKLSLSSNGKVKTLLYSDPGEGRIVYHLDEGFCSRRGERKENSVGPTTREREYPSGRREMWSAFRSFRLAIRITTRRCSIEMKNDESKGTSRKEKGDNQDKEKNGLPSIFRGIGEGELGRKKKSRGKPSGQEEKRNRILTRPK